MLTRYRNGLNTQERQRTENMISRLANSEKGTIYILGNSWSLNLLRIKDLCQSHKTLGINRILRTCSVNYLLTPNRDVLLLERNRVVTSKCVLLFFVGLRHTVEQLGLKSRTYYWDTYGDRIGTKTPGRFLFSGNSATYSIEAAALLGFKDIRLLGIDLVYPDKGPTHFFGACYVPSFMARELA